MMRKKRILLCNDASFLATGFGTYGKEVLTRLASTEKYELAEFASYGYPNDNRQINFDWKYYGNLPIGPDEERIYNSKTSNQFGEWRFDDVCIDFKPDIIFDIRDVQMLDYQESSPAREYFHWTIMPTIDAVPLHRSWVSTYMNADAVFSWTDWGIKVLNEESCERIKTKRAASPGINPEYKHITDKKNYKKFFGLNEDMLIIGTVMRNQQRKLYPELIRTFAHILKRAPEEIKTKLYLYLHTTYPDIKGWEIPQLLIEHGVSHRTLVTYICTRCGKSYPSYFQDVRAVCKFCKNFSAIMPHTQYSPPVSTLNQVYNLFDMYVQYSNCEGFGLPMIEAAACGIPVFAVNYSAMSDIVKKVNGTPIAVDRYIRDIDSGTLRALPDNFNFAHLALDFLLQPDTIRARRGYETTLAARENFNWDKTAKIWENHFDEVEIKDNWDSPAKFYIPNTNIPNRLSNTEFVKWCICNILGQPNLVNSFMCMNITEKLNYGYHNDKTLTRDIIVEHFINLRNTFNTFEEKRTCNVK